ncbi:MAG TPA: toll/interleukin-1 receptor domain-containing protein [Terriglobia bacterium]|nr:toll/interleukin-1 receptor domain-containing protein [Terriglobia bacterium]
MSEIFVSHVEEDKDSALEIASQLELSGYTTWYYERDSEPGPSYLLQIDRAIEQSLVIVVLISADALVSVQVTKEVIRAHEKGLPFIPILKGITHAEFQQRKPEWRMAMGGSTSILMPPTGCQPVVPHLLAGLKQLGVVPGAGKSTTAVPAAELPAPGRWKLKRKAVALAGGLLLFSGICFYSLGFTPGKIALELRVARSGFASEFTENFIEGKKFWTGGENWKVVDKKLQIEGPGVAFLKDRIYKDFIASFDLQLLKPNGARWLLRAQDESNYYLFQLTGPQGNPPNVFKCFRYRRGNPQLLVLFPVNLDLSDPTDWIHITIEARGSQIIHKIDVTSQPKEKSQNLADLEDRAFSYGYIGFGAESGEEFYLATITISPQLQDP